MADIFTDIIEEGNNGVGVKVEGVHHKDGRIRLLQQSTPANPPANEIWLYPKTDGVLYFKLPDGTEKSIQTITGVGSKSAFQRLDYEDDKGNYRTHRITTSGSHRFTFIIPSDFTNLAGLNLVGIIGSGADGSGKDIDLSSDYAKQNELFNTNSESDTATSYDFTGKTDVMTYLDISSVFSSIEANHICGVFVDHNAIGGSIDYIGVLLEYN